MAQKCGGRILTDEEVHENVLKALSLEEKKDLRRLGKEYEDRRVDAVDNVCGEDGKPLAEMDAIVLKNKTSATNSLSQTEWASMEAAMPAEERQTHRNLQVYFMERAKAAGVKEQKEEEEEEDDPEMLALLGDGEVPEGGDADSDAEEDPRDAQRKKQEEEDKEAVGTVEKSKNWSSVNLAFQESKLNYRGSFSALSFTNWLWFRVVRPKLEETKSKLPELSDEEMDKYGIQDVEDVLGEFMPAMKKKEEKEDKKDKKDKDKDKDKKDKKDKEDDKKKDKKDDKKDSKKKKKDAVQLNAKEKVQVQNLIKNMIYGESGKNKSITTGWVNLIDEKDMPRLTPWEFQLAHIMRTSMAMEYSAKKKKEVPDLNLYYEMCQSLADAIGLIKKQYLHEFPQNSFEDVLPIQEALALQSRFREGSVTGAKFDLLWYLQNGAHLLAGSSFAKKHRTTVFKPFKIQELMIDAVLQPGPQLVFGIAPPGTGKTAVVSHILNLFPVHTHWALALHWLRKLCDGPLQPDGFSAAAAIRACEHAGQWPLALALLQGLGALRISADVVVYSSAITTCEKNQQWKMALRIFEQMEEQGVVPNAVTYAACISACGRQSDWRQALHLLMSARDAQQFSTIACNATISACANGHEWQVPLRLLQLAPQKTLLTFSSAISACERCAQWQHALGILEEMQRVLFGDTSVVNLCISACVKADQAQMAAQLLRKALPDRS